MSKSITLNIFSSLLLGFAAILLFLPASAKSQSNVNLLFDEANAELQEGNYAQSLNIYKKIDSTQFESGPLYLNMGIAYINVDSLGMAKYYFMKAEQFDETREQAEEGLAYVNEQFSRQSAVLPKLPWQIAFDWLNANLGAKVVLFIGLTLLNIGILINILRWFINIIPRFLKISGLSLASAGLVIVGLSFYLSYLDARYTEAVMVDEQVGVAEKPSSDAAIVSQAYEGYDFTVDKRKSKNTDGWIYVRMSNGQYGWIPRHNIRIL